MPVKVEKDFGWFTIRPQAFIFYTDSTVKLAELLQDYLQKQENISVTISVSKNSDAKGIFLTLDHSMDKASSYVLDVTSKRIKIIGKDQAGVFYGIPNATTQELMDSARPEFAVISVGSGNSFGLPRAETLARLAAAGTRVFAEELRQAQEQLNSITGEFAADDLLGEIFSRFCIGK